MAQTPQQRRANAQFAKSEEAKRGKPISALKKKTSEKVDKAPISKGWMCMSPISNLTTRGEDGVG
ncbi:hypothetical protein LTR12_006369 [Friedmanniomyces endolithicus]|nr:hypothetical protein LTR74_010740 [Friedmanniomyces endolithicus]KAK1819179.1 hypothetical protein LTR12_006369 [Friedmanniomyces endolithicus]